MKEFKENQLPYRTEVIMQGFNCNEISIIKETDKAFLLCYTKSIKKGTSLVSEIKEFTLWCPKSVWFNDKNFIEDEYKNEKIFNPPYFLRK